MDASLGPGSDDEPSWMAALDEDQRARITRLLDNYLVHLEQGERLSLTDLTIGNEDLASTLREYVAQIDRLHRGTLAMREDPLGSVDALASTEEEIHRLGDFQLVREIGRGGMGVVYEAIQESLGRRVALKLLPLAAMFSANQVARFRNEAQAAALLQHPNIIPVYAVGSEKGIHYYAMQLIEGQPLDEVISELRYGTPVGNATSWLKEAFTKRTRLQVLLELGIAAADALQAAHEVGVVHRDIKPSNLMLDSNGKIWVADFGLVRMESNKSLTRTGELVGTVRYMSPEQATGESALIDHRTDIYSLGATLYELIGLQAAISGDDSPALIHAIANQDPIPLKRLRNDVPKDLESVLCKAMSKIRDERYLTAKDFSEDLRRVLEGRPTLAKPTNLATHFARWTARHRDLVVVFLAMSGLAILGLAVSIFAINSQKREAEKNLRIAMQNLEDAREAVDEFGSKLAERLDGLPGTEGVRQEILARTLRHYQNLVGRSKENRSLGGLLAETYHRMGNLARKLTSSKDAITYYQSASNEYERLKRSNPNDYELLHRTSQNQCSLGIALSESGELEKGRASIIQGLESSRSLLNAFPKHARSLHLLATSLNDLGWVDLRLGNHQASRNSFLEAITILQEALAIEDSQEEFPELRILQANALNNLASTYENNEPNKAIELYQQSIDLRRAHEEASHSVYSSIETAITWNNLASSQAKLRLFSEAEESYRKAIAIQRDWVTLSPSIPEHQRDLASSLNNLGLLFSQSGQSQQAIASYQEAISILQNLLARMPEDLDSRSGLGGTYNNLAMHLEKSNQLQGAAEAYHQGIQQQQRAYEAAPEVLRYRDFLAKQYFNFAKLQESLHQWEEVAALAKKRASLFVDDPQSLLAIARELAELAAKVGGREQGARLSKPLAQEAIEILTLGKKAGLVLTRDIMNADPLSSLLPFDSADKLISP